MSLGEKDYGSLSADYDCLVTTSSRCASDQSEQANRWPNPTTWTIQWMVFRNCQFIGISFEVYNDRNL